MTFLKTLATKTSKFITLLYSHLGIIFLSFSFSSRMAEPSGYVGHLGSAAASGAPQPPLQPNSSSSGSNSLTPLGSGKSPISTSSSSPHSTLGQSPNNGYHPQHLRPAANVSNSIQFLSTPLLARVSIFIKHFFLSKNSIKNLHF
jgi:hypothetical protein